MNTLIRSKWVLVVALLATAALYWPGLNGPYLLDDFWNLAPIERWHSGTHPWQLTLFPNYTSFLFSRPVSMGAFMFNAWLGGTDSFSFKLGNLVIHLACGLAGWWVLRRALAEDRKLAPHAELISAVAAALWLLHPLHVSTVLYVVQRMAQLSMLFTLASVGVYLLARRQLIEGRLRAAIINLFVVFPLLLAAGMLSKQNAAVAPFVCLALELAYFTGQRRHGRVTLTFFAAFAGLPLLATMGLLAVAPEHLLRGYAEWNFTLTQRLLTQPLALMDYLGMLLVPRGPLMGLYTDDFRVSTGLFSPLSTIWAIFGIAALSGVAIWLRERAPSLFAGWFFFLAAHAVESTFLPLEMYYEHRNYLPAIGFFLAISGLLALAPEKLHTRVLSGKALGVLAVSTFALVLCFATLGRVLVWQHEETIIEQGVANHPDSMRAALDKTGLGLRKQDYTGAIASVSPLVHSENARHRLVGRLYVIALRCLRDGNVAPRELDAAIAGGLPELTVYELQMAKLLENVVKGGQCGDLSPVKLADGFVALAEAATAQAETSAIKYSIRMLTIPMYAGAGRLAEAQTQAEISWAASAHPPTAAILTRLYARNGLYGQAAQTLQQLEGRVKRHDAPGQAELRSLRQLLRQAEKGQAPKPAGILANQAAEP